MMDDRAQLAAFVNARLTELEHHAHTGLFGRPRAWLDRTAVIHGRLVLDAWRGDNHGDPVTEQRLCSVASRFSGHPDFREGWQINEPW